jgi:hypothetical protein
MSKSQGSFEITLNPSGFIEEKYIGHQDELDVISGVSKLNYYSKKLSKQNKPVLILIDLSELGTTTAQARIEGIKTLRTLTYKRMALYGPLPSQVLANTLAFVAGKQNKVCAFGTRAEAICWLQQAGLAKNHARPNTKNI